jgi:NADH dehydrogenase
MDIVTGAFGYIGKYIAAALLEQGRAVRTITTHPDKPNPFGERLAAFPYSFDDPARLVETLAGAEALYNTYWIRFPYAEQTYEQALANTATLFRCAQQAGVGRIVHIGVTRATLDSPLPYYRGKAIQEELLKACGVAYSIVRPTLVFGREDILVNNIAWLIRKSPVFPIFGGGDYRVQPVYVGDLAQIALEQAASLPGATLDAIGPETYTFEQFVRHIAQALGRRPRFLHVSPGLGITLGQLIGRLLGDVLLTRNELQGLMDELLTSTQAPNGPTRFSDWLEQNRSSTGATYSSELARHFRWTAETGA